MIYALIRSVTFGQRYFSAITVFFQAMRHLFRRLLKPGRSHCFARCSSSANGSRGNRTNSNFSNVSAIRRYMSTLAEEETVFKSPRPKEDLPVIPLTDYMFSRFAKFGSKTALVSLFRIKRERIISANIVRFYQHHSCRCQNDVFSQT